MPRKEYKTLGFRLDHFFDLRNFAKAFNFLLLFSQLFDSAISAERPSSSSTRSKSLQLETENDPNLQYQCRGALGEHGACTCYEFGESGGQEVACINAQFVDTGSLMYIVGNYDSATSLTFHGNNFQELPNAPLFGQQLYTHLKVLNLSANYIVNLNSEALQGTPNIEVLDLSNNEIVLTNDNVDFLSHTPLLTHLYLRRAFASPTNRSIQFEIMMRMFSRAKLHRLKHLDLSYNFFNTVSYNLPCNFPSLAILDLRQNLLRTGAINRNYIHELSLQFRRDFADHLPPQSLNIRNSFFCDCKSADWISWLKSAKSIKDKSLLTCMKASPANLTGVQITRISTAELDCKTDLFANDGRGVRIEFAFMILTLVISTGFLLLIFA